MEWEIYWQGKKSKIQLEQHIRLKLRPVQYCLHNLPSAPMPRGRSRSVLRAADWYLRPSSAASGIFLTYSPQHCLVCFSWVQIIPSPRVHISHSHFPTSLASICITPKALTQLPHALVSLSVKAVVTSYSFVGILLLLVLCCTIPWFFLRFFSSLFIPLHLFPSISPSPHPSPISFIPPF